MWVFLVFAITFVVQSGYSGFIHGGLEGGFGEAGGIAHGEHGHYIDYHAHPKYHYDYAVHDLKHNDIKHQWETRDGDKVKGEYSLIEPDGTKRIVQYEADKHTGFNAIVKRVGHAIQPTHNDGHGL